MRSAMSADGWSLFPISGETPNPARAVLEACWLDDPNLALLVGITEIARRGGEHPGVGPVIPVLVFVHRRLRIAPRSLLLFYVLLKSGGHRLVEQPEPDLVGAP